MIKTDDIYVNALNTILDEIDYVFLIKNIRGYSDFIDPWPDYNKMKELITSQINENSELITLFCLGTPISYQLVKESGYKKYIDLLIEANILTLEKGILSTNNFTIITYQGLKILTEINPWYGTCKNKNTDVYIGIDSLRLGENIKFNKNDVVLDLCSGTGIQGLLAAKSASKVISVEINPKAAKVIEFNAKLNNLYEVIEVRIGNLYSVLSDREMFDVIYANPPFIPMLNGVNYPICGAGGMDGLKVLNEIIDKLESHLTSVGEAIIFCQCLGNNTDVFFDSTIRKYGEENKWKIFAAVIDKIPVEYQVHLLSNLTALYNEEFDKKDFEKEMLSIYSDLKASYLYSIIYKIKKGNQFTFNTLKLCNDWGFEDTAVLKEGISIKKDNYYQILKDDEKLGFLDDEAKNTIDLIKKYGSLEAVKTNVMNESCNRDMLCRLLQVCSMLEKIGVIEKKTA